MRSRSADAGSDVKVRWDSGTAKMNKVLEDAACVDGVFQTDTSRHTAGRRMIEADTDGGTVLVEPREGFPTLRVAYFFAGTHRKGSIADQFAKLCRESGYGLKVCEVDIHVGGSDHDLLDRDKQEEWLARIRDGDFDFVILSPPCASWSRSQYANNLKPQPVRSKKHPWGLPGLLKADRRRAETGNTFILFAIRAIVTATEAKRRGVYIRTLLEHPEDLGKTPRGTPASIWQLDQLRKAHGEFPHVSVAGHQCPFGADRAKPTRLMSDIEEFAEFGFPGWPIFDHDDQYLGPLPKSCGHRHRDKMIGRTPQGGYYTSPTAAYPPDMCAFIALRFFNDFCNKFPAPCGGGVSSTKRSGRVSTPDDSKRRRRTVESTHLQAHSNEQSTSSRDGITEVKNLGSSDNRRARPRDDREDNSQNGIEHGKSGRESLREDVCISDLQFGPTLVTQEVVEEATERANEKGVGRPIKDGLEDDKGLSDSEVDEPMDPSTKEDRHDGGDVTTDEEPELPGTRRPKYGEGWWGRGPEQFEQHHVKTCDISNAQNLKTYTVVWQI